MNPYFEGSLSAFYQRMPRSHQRLGALLYS